MATTTLKGLFMTRVSPLTKSKISVIEVFFVKQLNDFQFYVSGKDDFL